jgi:hypothetical protein
MGITEAITAVGSAIASFFQAWLFRAKQKDTAAMAAGQAAKTDAAFRDQSVTLTTEAAKGSQAALEELRKEVSE